RKIFASVAQEPVQTRPLLLSLCSKFQTCARETKRRTAATFFGRSSPIGGRLFGSGVAAPSVMTVTIGVNTRHQRQESTAPGPKRIRQGAGLGFFPWNQGRRAAADVRGCGQSQPRSRMEGGRRLGARQAAQNI